MDASSAKGGNIDDYFALFGGGVSGGNSFGLDKDDKRMIARLCRYCSLCPQCYRPYSFVKITKDIDNSKSKDEEEEFITDRYDKHHVLMHVISCYFFLFLVWIPLMLIMLIPALFSKLMAKMNQMEQTSFVSHHQLDASAYGDFHPSVQQQTVKNIMNSKYNGDRTFDDDYDLDDGDDDDSELYKLQKTIDDLVEKVEVMNKKQNEKA